MLIVIDILITVMIMIKFVITMMVMTVLLRTKVQQ